MEEKQNTNNFEVSQLEKEQNYYPSVIMNTIKTFYTTISKKKSRERDEILISEINKMMKQIEIFEDTEIIEKEFKEIKEYLKGKNTIPYYNFIELLHKIAVVCQRVWHRKGLLLTPVPYKEDIYKDLQEKWKETYPDKFPDQDVKNNG